MNNEILELYQLGFPEDGEFASFYVENKGDPLTIRKDGRLAAMLFPLKKKIHLFGKQLSVPFVSGATTHPDFRKRGLMAKLLKELEEESTFVFLAPFSHEFYEKLGYTTYAFEGRLERETKGFVTRELTETDFLKVHEVYASFCKNFNGFFLRSEEDTLFKIRELHAGMGKIFGVFKDSQMIAYYMFYEKDKISEFARTVDVEIPNAPVPQPRGKKENMVKIANFKKALEQRALSLPGFGVYDRESLRVLKREKGQWIEQVSSICGDALEKLKEKQKDSSLLFLSRHTFQSLFFGAFTTHVEFLGREEDFQSFAKLFPKFTNYCPDRF